MKKKSGAAQRLVSLVLALGLIFTLAPASVFAGDEVPASSTVTATAGEEPVVDTTEPAVDGTEPAVDGTEPAVDGTEPAVDGTEPVVDGTEPAADDSEPAVDGTEPVADGTEPVADGTEPAVDDSEPAVEEELSSQQTALLAASVPAVMSNAPEAKGIGDETFHIASCDTSLTLFAGYRHWGWSDDGIIPIYKVLEEWQGESFGDFTLDIHNIAGAPGVYYFVKAPNGMIPEVSFEAGGKNYPDGWIYSLDNIPEGDVPSDFVNEAKKAGCNYVFYFSAHLVGNKIGHGDTVNITVTAKEASAKTQSAYFYLHRPDVESGSEAVKTDYYYIGEGSVNIPYDLELGYIVNNPSADKITAPQPSNSIIFDNELRDITEFTFDKDGTGAPGTYSFVSWDVIKCENGATTAYPDNEVIVENGLTWHVDGTIQLNRPAAYFYGLKPGAEATSTNPDDYYYLGTGEVTLEPATVKEIGRTVDLDKTNRDKLVDKEPEKRTFPSIEYNGVRYYFDVAGTEEPYTYSVSDWNNVMGAKGAKDEQGASITTDPTWHVNCAITLNGPVDVPDTINQPKEGALQDVDVVYDGKTHVLEMGKYVHFSEEYQVKNEKGEWVNLKDWNPQMTIPYLIDCGYMEVKVIYTYNKPAGDQNVYNTIEDEAFIRVNQRPITLKANDDKISDGDPIPKFTFTITSGSLAEGDNIIDVTYGGYANKLGIYNLVITGYKIVDAKDNNADVAGNYDVTLLPGVFTIGTAGGGGGTTPNPNPNPNPTPVPVPVEPETPVTPVAPVTPDEEEEEPAEVEDIEDEETPQASPDTDADKEEDKTENIEDEETAQAGAPGEGNWALLNLILMVLTVVAGLAMLALRFARKTGMAHLLGIVPAIVALVAFFVTEDMSLPMAMTDKWTLIMALIAVVQVVLLVLGRNGAQEDDQPREQY
ncbi:hypothetical protein [Candidatus Allofournierella excrementavium]|uniref:hypothetical protein n=1 Tax=Candidatus Allofournierella excrementavium TaxID=2838591 RepID=UPI003AF96E6C